MKVSLSCPVSMCLEKKIVYSKYVRYFCMFVYCEHIIIYERHDK